MELCELIYGVKFFMFEFIYVKGDDVDLLFCMLVKVIGEVLSWNFNKYFVDKNGNIVKYYKSLVKLLDKLLCGDVVKVLVM